MKYNFFKSLAFLVLIGLAFGCNPEPKDLVTQNAKTGGLVKVENQLHVYKKGDSAKEFVTSVIVYQGSVKTNVIHIYKQYFTAAGEKSNLELLRSIDIEDKSKTTVIEFAIKYAELAENLSINGDAMDTGNDDALTVGDAWVLTYKAETDEGNKFLNKATTKVGVSGRLAGTYTNTRGWYIHPASAPNITSSFAGNTRVIESVSDGLYKMTTMGAWPDTDNPIFFTADEDNFTLAIPKEIDGKVQKVWGGADEVANCIDNPANLPDVTCTNTFSYEDDGHDIINISYGYIRSSGTRQFDEILKKN